MESRWEEDPNFNTFQQIKLIPINSDSVESEEQHENTDKSKDHNISRKKIRSNQSNFSKTLRIILIVLIVLFIISLIPGVNESLNNDNL